MSEKILVINPGSTSTKIAVYDGEQEVWKESISHSLEELKNYPTIFDQKDMRKALIEKALAEHGDTLDSFAGFVSRGGAVGPVKAGAIEVNDILVNILHYHPVDQHASNIGAAIAKELADSVGKKAYIYDGITVDEMSELNQITGLKGIRRPARGHNLNTRAAALRYCRENGLEYAKTDLIVVHLGGGITMNLHVGGKMVDMVMDEDGMFAPERAGMIPTFALVRMAYSGEYTQAELMKQLQRRGGVISHLGTANMQEVEKMIADGDEYAALVYRAMALNVAKYIGELAVSNRGHIDAIILTGGLAYSEMFTDMIKEYASFLGKIVILPGENEMAALAGGALRVLRGEEEATILGEDYEKNL